jgi:hypothetical protein
MISGHHHLVHLAQWKSHFEIRGTIFSVGGWTLEVVLCWYLGVQDVLLSYS